MAGLIFPDNLGQWQRWHERRHRARHLKGQVFGRVRPEAPLRPVLTSQRGNRPPRGLIVLESTSPTTLVSLLRPLESGQLAGGEVAVLAPTGVAGRLPGAWTERVLDERTARETIARARVIAAAGHYLPLGSLAYQAKSEGAEYLVVQHGLMTPLAPPLPAGAHLLAWSEADAAFWSSGRSDVSTQAVGSQLLHEAAAHPATGVDPSAPPVYLGQLHAAELPRRGLARAAGEFCASTGATYRPHPSERDRLSVLQHRVWERRGITIDHSGEPLTALCRPVVSVFSTGVLEAAARGVPAWVDYPDPPVWLREFWDRYGMSRWGGEPTPAPADASTPEPAVAVGACIARRVEGAR